MGNRHTELNDDRADLMSCREQDQKFVAAVTKAHPTLVDVGRVPVANTKPISARMTRKRPAISAVRAPTAEFVSAFTSSAFSAIAEITAIRCDLPVP